MDDETLKALQASIVKWEKNAAATDLSDIMISAEDCPLCKLFFKDDCIGCPVNEKADCRWCDGSPYELVTYALNWSDFESAVKYSKSEVKFLRSLLPANIQTEKTTND